MFDVHTFTRDAAAMVAANDAARLAHLVHLMAPYGAGQVVTR